MNVTELKQRIASKPGYLKELKDEIALDSPEVGSIEKRVVHVATENSDGTRGITNVFYLLDKETGEASFYNFEADELTSNGQTDEQRRFEALDSYLKGKYDAHRILWADVRKNLAEAEVYTLSSDKSYVTRKVVLVFKKGTNPISDLDIR